MYKIHKISALVFIFVGLLYGDPIDDVAKQLKEAKDLKEFSSILQKVDLKALVNDPAFQQGLIDNGFNKDYVKV